MARNNKRFKEYLQILKQIPKKSKDKNELKENIDNMMLQAANDLTTEDYQRLSTVVLFVQGIINKRNK